MRYLLIAPFLLAAAPAQADEAPPASADRSEGAVIPVGNEIVVLASRMRGEIDAAQPPVMTLDENEIASYGAASLAELVAAISPQTGSGRGRGEGHPVMLVNGQRVSSFREMRNIPPEAIRKVEVLPEEVSLKFGYPPNQRVINFILKDNFSTVTVAGEYNVPTRGGFTNTEFEAGLVRIDGPRRLNIEAKATDDSLLTDGERGVLQATGSIPTVAGDPDPAAFRSLIDDSRDLTLNATWSAGLGEEGMAGSFSLNGAVTQSDSRALLGLDTVVLTAPDGATAVRSLAGPLERVRDARTYQAGATLNRRLGDWQLTATIDASHVDTRTRVDRKRDMQALVDAAAAGLLPVGGVLPALPGAGLDRTRSRDLSAASLVTLSGSPLLLPAGEVSLTVRGGFDYDRSRNSDTSSVSGQTTLKRGDISGGFNLAVPLTSRREGVLDAIGDITLNFSAGINDLSDFGTLSDWNAGITWNPTEKLGLQASYIVNEAAPSLSDLGGPELEIANVAVFDFTRGETALVTIVTGGNPDLVKEKQRDLKLSANWELPFMERSNLIVEYFRNSSDNVTRAFPLLTPAIEAAFPKRVTRLNGQPNGRLTGIDRRPVTYDRVEGSRIRWGFNLSGQLGKEAAGRGAMGPGAGSGQPSGAQRDGQRQGAGGPGAGGPGAGGPGTMRGPMGMGRGGPPGGRWNLSVYHTYRLDEMVRIVPGGAVLDLLGGDALTVGGVSRHSLEFEGGLFKDGKGLRLNGSWMAPVDVRSSGAPGSSDLRFGSVFRLDARAFINLGMQQKLVDKYPILKGVRIAISADNLLDSRQKVTDPSGLTPISDQKDFRDPRGRVIGIDIRKMF